MTDINFDGLSRPRTDIAIVGASIRVPGAESIAQFWFNLVHGIESISLLSDDELLTAGVDRALFSRPNYIKARGAISEIDRFDADFFGYSLTEAELIDPQQRILLECVWEAIEYAGYDTSRYKGLVGVFAGSAPSDYQERVTTHRDIVRRVGALQAATAYQADFLATRISYKLDLHGPSMFVSTACSTGLVAIHYACQSLLCHECDMALAGGVSINLADMTGYLWDDAGITSSDGHCRAFDVNADGTVFGSGAAIVVLKRYADAIQDGDNVMAVIRGTAVNNDGARKVGFSAPSFDGQVEVISRALTVAGIDPGTVSYIEAHGTGTPLGDPIEVAALNEAFGGANTRSGSCAIGSVKTNVGHLNHAAGTVGLIKSALVLKNRTLVPSLNCKQPNPHLQLDGGPFYINTETKPWETDSVPRRAGVTSLGIGGTNAHAVLEEAAIRKASISARTHQLLVLSARTESALIRQRELLANSLQANRDVVDLADISHTLRVGRREFSYRWSAVCSTIDEAIGKLKESNSRGASSGYVERNVDRPVVFLFPGQGTQYVGMGADLYRTEPFFRAQFNRCAAIVEEEIGVDLRSIICEEPSKHASAALIDRLDISLPAVFTLEYTLACLWKERNVQPIAMIGHSVGEYVAACIAGVFTLEEALHLVIVRGRLVDRTAPGAMLSVLLSESQVRESLPSNLDLASVNAPSLCVVSGTKEAIAAYEAILASRSIECRRIEIARAGHSHLLDPIIGEFEKEVARTKLQPPTVPLMSNLTGTWITEHEATDPTFWSRHLRQTVQFSACINTALEAHYDTFLEVGPGHSLKMFLRQHIGAGSEITAFSSLSRKGDDITDDEVFLDTIGRLWCSGNTVDLTSITVDEMRLRVPLPTYPFERERCWIDETPARALSIDSPNAMKQKVADWLYSPVWKRVTLLNEDRSQPFIEGSWLILSDGGELCAQLVEKLLAQGASVTTVYPANQFQRNAVSEYTVMAGDTEQFEKLLLALEVAGDIPTNIANFWCLVPPSGDSTILGRSEHAHQFGYASIVALARALGRRQVEGRQTHLWTITRMIYPILGNESTKPEYAPVIGASRVIPIEYGKIDCRVIDLGSLPADDDESRRILAMLLREFTTSRGDVLTAIRGRYCWVQQLEPVTLEQAVDRTPIRRRGIYLITGGLGGIGLAIADHLIRTEGAKVALVSRTGVPAASEWDTWIASHDEKDQISERIRGLRRIAESGGQPLVLSADVSDEPRMREVVREVISYFGGLDGVIHASGVPAGSVIDLTTPEMEDAVLRPKVAGALVLDSVLRDIPLDFVVYCSSLNAFFGGAGQSAHCAANAFLDAFAATRNAVGRSWTVSINWGLWGTVGAAYRTAQPPVLQRTRDLELKDGMSAAEGVDVFDRVIRSGLSWVVVSTQDLLNDVAAANQNRSANTLLDQKRTTKSNVPTRSRPRRLGQYVAPTNNVELYIATLWQELLSCEQVGIHDSFLELGGHSLIGIQVASRIRKEYGIRMPVSELFKSPTVSELSRLIINEVLTEVEAISEGEAQRLSHVDPGLAPVVTPGKLL
jgi:acyl transferase domain-containing protein/acyl carrier protein